MNIKDIKLDEALAHSDEAELVRGKRRRWLPEEGDIFKLKLAAGGDIIGRVVIVGPADMHGQEREPDADWYLTYFYWPGSMDKGELRLDDLMLPPLIIMRELWLDGWAWESERREIGEYPVLPRHCLFHSFYRCLHDEDGQVLKDVVRPCGHSAHVFKQGLCKWLKKSLDDGFDPWSHPLAPE